MSDNERTAGGLVHRFHLIMDAIGDLPENDVEHVEELVQVGEWQVALELLCTQVYEYEIKVDKELLKMIAALGRDVGVQNRYWKVLGPEQ